MFRRRYSTHVHQVLMIDRHASSSCADYNLQCHRGSPWTPFWEGILREGGYNHREYLPLCLQLWLTSCIAQRQERQEILREYLAVKFASREDLIEL